MYRQSGAGKAAVPPAMLTMATLGQGYVGASDAEAVEMTVVDRRWQLVLDCLGADKPAFSQGALQAFREWLIEHDMNQRLLERTVEVARETGRHVVRDVDTGLIVSCAVRPANEPEADVLQEFVEQMRAKGVSIAESYMDRGYLSSPALADIEASGGQVICRPWTARNRAGRFTKDDFDIDIEQIRVSAARASKASSKSWSSPKGWARSITLASPPAF